MQPASSAPKSNPSPVAAIRGVEGALPPLWLAQWRHLPQSVSRSVKPGPPKRPRELAEFHTPQGRYPCGHMARSSLHSQQCSPAYLGPKPSIAQLSAHLALGVARKRTGRKRDGLRVACRGAGCQRRGSSPVGGRKSRKNGNRKKSRYRSERPLMLYRRKSRKNGNRKKSQNSPVWVLSGCERSAAQKQEFREISNSLSRFANFSSL